MRALIFVAALLLLIPWIYTRVRPAEVDLTFWPNGQIRERTGVVYDSGGERVYHGEFKSFYETGPLKAEGGFELGERHGLWCWYSESGDKRASCEYDRGEGRFTGYYPTGEMTWTGMVAQEQRQGLWILYAPDGRKQAECDYEDNYGRYTSWFPNGHLLQEGFYEGGKRVDHWVTYYQDGRKELEGDYLDGKLHGRWRHWSTDDPQILTENVFEHDERIR